MFMILHDRNLQFINIILTQYHFFRGFHNLFLQLLSVFQADDARTIRGEFKNNQNNLGNKL